MSRRFGRNQQRRRAREEQLGLIDELHHVSAVNREGGEACVWCALSPAKRRRWVRRQALVAAGILLVAALLSIPTAR